MAGCAVAACAEAQSRLAGADGAARAAAAAAFEATLRAAAAEARAGGREARERVCLGDAYTACGVQRSRPGHCSAVCYRAATPLGQRVTCAEAGCDEYVLPGSRGTAAGLCAQHHYARAAADTAAESARLLAAAEALAAAAGLGAAAAGQAWMWTGAAQRAGLASPRRTLALAALPAARAALPAWYSARGLSERAAQRISHTSEADEPFRLFVGLAIDAAGGITALRPEALAAMALPKEPAAWSDFVGDGKRISDTLFAARQRVGGLEAADKAAWAAAQAARPASGWSCANCCSPKQQGCCAGPAGPLSLCSGCGTRFARWRADAGLA